MSTVKFPEKEYVETTAAEWVAAIDRGLSTSEEGALSIWLDVSSAHGEALVKCASMWDLLDVLSPIAKLLPIDENSAISVGMPRPLKTGFTVVDSVIKKTPWTRYAMVASLILSVAVVSVLSLSVRPELNISNPLQVAEVDQIEVQGQSYVTAVGEISNVSLADGTNLQLNTDTEVIVKFSQWNRTVVLKRGEVFFDVAKDASRPFVVEADRERVTAIGTAFSVDRSRAQGTEVLVTEGKVRVNRVDEMDNEKYSDVFLIPGQKVLIEENSSQVSINNDAEAQLAWRDGIVVFQGESLAVAIKEIDRYTPLTFTIVDEEIANIPVGGFFKTGDLDQLLLVLEQNFGVKSYRLGEEILLSKVKK